MTTDHRAEAERYVAELHRDQPHGWDHRPLTDAATAHALLAIHDLLEARLPQTPPSSTPAAPVGDEVGDLLAALDGEDA